MNPFPNKPWFLRVCSTSLLKTLWEKEKLLLTSNFSFSHSVFYPFGEFAAIFIKYDIAVCKLLYFGRVLNLSFGKELALFTWVLCSQVTFICLSPSLSSIRLEFFCVPQKKASPCDQDQYSTNILSEFHDNQTENVASRAYTRFF